MRTTTLHFRSLAKGGVDFPFRSPVTPPPLLPQHGNRPDSLGSNRLPPSQGEQRPGWVRAWTKRPTLLQPSSLPPRGRPSLYQHPDSDFQPARYTFPVLLAATAHKLTEQRVVSPISTARLSRKKRVWNFNQRELLDCTNSASKLLLQPKAFDMLINVDFEIFSLK